MLADPFLANEFVLSGGAVQQPFTLANLAGNASVRKVITPASVEHPSMMRISHTKVGKGSQERNRHLLRFDTPLVVAGQLVPNMSTAAYVVLDMPVADVSNAHTYLWRTLIGTLLGGSGNVAYNGSTGNFWNRWKAGES